MQTSALATTRRIAVTCVEVAGALLALATLAAFGARMAWALELLVHWRAVLGLLLALVVLICWSASHKRRALLALAAAALNGWQVAELAAWQDRPAIAQTSALKVFLANVAFDNFDSAGVASEIARADADVVVLEEVGARWLAELAPTLADYPHRLEVPLDHPFGIAVYSRLALLDSNVEMLSEHSAPSIVVRVATPGGPITVLATHPRPPFGPASQALRDEQLAAIASYSARSVGPLVVVGDLNTSPLAPSFQDFVSTSGLMDGARGFGWQPTWRAPLPAVLCIQLDHLLHSQHLVVRSFAVGRETGSDHRPIVVDLGFAESRQ